MDTALGTAGIGGVTPKWGIKSEVMSGVALVKWEKRRQNHLRAKMVENGLKMAGNELKMVATNGLKMGVPSWLKMAENGVKMAPESPLGQNVTKIWGQWGTIWG